MYKKGKIMIKLENISIGYNTIVVRNKLNYKSDEGKIYGILGESGVGKSTLLKTIAGLIPSLEGNMEIKVPTKEIFMMHQSYTCFDWLNCLDNILITERVKLQRITPEIRDKAYVALESVGLFDHMYNFPTQLSGGQRQRLALARTLFTSPKVILMDEPLSALDEETRTKMQDLILQNHKENHNTIIMITHSKAEAEKMCDEIINL
jgi:ABC-type nitrate/sulfonate/bicarbonate transport system ATPase subunit